MGYAFDCDQGQISSYRREIQTSSSLAGLWERHEPRAEKIEKIGNTAHALFALGFSQFFCLNGRVNFVRIHKRRRQLHASVRHFRTFCSDRFLICPDDNLSAHGCAFRKVDHVLVKQPDAAGSIGVADRPEVVRAMNAEPSIAPSMIEIKGS